jgi:hypothetical protein
MTAIRLLVSNDSNHITVIVYDRTINCLLYQRLFSSITMASTTPHDTVSDNQKIADSVDIEQQGNPAPLKTERPKTLGAGVSSLISNRENLFTDTVYSQR